MPEITIDNTSYQLPEGITVVGRSADADLTIDSTKLSRTHARFTVEGDTVSIEDLGSKNGTFVNGKAIDEKHTISKTDTVMIADLKVTVKFPGEPQREEKPVPAEKEPAAARPAPSKKKAPGAEGQRSRQPGKDKKFPVGLLAGIGGAALLIIIIIFAVSGEPEGLAEAQALLAQAESDIKAFSVTDSIEDNVSAIQELERIKGKLTQIRPELKMEHDKADRLSDSISRTIREIESKNAELKAAKTASDRYAAVLEENKAEDITPQQKVANLEQYMSVFPNAPERAEAMGQISEIKRTVRAQERDKLRKTKTDAKQLISEEKFAEATDLIDAALTAEYYQLETADLSPLKEIKTEISSKAEEYFSNIAEEAVRKAKTGSCDQILDELSDAFVFLRMPSAQTSFDKAVSEINTIKQAKIAQAKKEIEAEYKKAESLIAMRQYAQAHEIFEKLMNKVTENEFTQEISRKKNRNYLYKLAKKFIIAYVKKKKGVEVEGIGFIQDMNDDKVTVKVDLDSMFLKWERIKPEEFAALTTMAAENYPSAELYASCGLINLEAERNTEADKWLKKALAVSPLIAQDYPGVFKEFKEKLAARKAELAKRRAEDAEAEIAKAKPIDLSSPWADYIDKTPWITDNKIYVSNTGDDRNAGSSPGKPMRTVKEALAKGSGKTILLQRGSVFREEPGKIGNGTVLSAFGPANLPLPRISGSIEIKNWSKHSGKIYTATVDREIRHLFCNGERMNIARYPNEGWLRTQQGSDSYKIVDTELAKHPRNAPGYWNGAQVRWRKWSWWYETRPITNWDGRSVLKLGTKPELDNTGINGGYYIDNKLEELDAPGEWYFDSENKKVYLLAPNGADPNKILVEGMCFDSALGASNCKIENICFSHQWDKALSVTRTVEVRSCSFVGQRGNAINAGFDCENTRIYGNFFDNILNVAIWWNEKKDSPSQSTIEYNVFRNIGSVPGYGGNGPWHAAGVIICNASGCRVQKNVIEDTGYAGILLGAPGNFAEYNIIRRAMCTLNDGAAIYTNCDRSTIRYNLIFDTEGDLESSHDSFWKVGNKQFSKKWANLGHGIWPEFLKEFKQSVIEYNTVLNSGAFGIFHPNNFENTVRYNVLYNNARAQLQLSGRESGRRPQKNLFEGNVMFACSETQAALLFGPEYDYGTMKGNYFCNPFSTTLIQARGNNWGQNGLTIADWQAKYKWADKEAKVDLDKNKSSLLVINDTLETRDVPVPGSYRDLDGKGYSRKVTLEPFRSIVLIGGNHKPGAYITWTMMQSTK